MMFQYKLRPYTQADFEFVYRVKKEAYRDYVENFWGKWDEVKQRALFCDFIQKVQASLSIIEHNGTPIGIYHGAMMNEDTYEIGNIIIIPEYQRKGIGQDILQNIIQSHPKLKMRLRVFKGNPARTFYKKLNFTITDETQAHIIMERG